MALNPPVLPQTTGNINTLVANLLAQGIVNCRIMILSGFAFDFVLTGFTQDAVVGHISSTPDKIAVVPYNAIGTFEY